MQKWFESYRQKTGFSLVLDPTLLCCVEEKCGLHCFINYLSNVKATILSFLDTGFGFKNKEKQSKSGQYTHSFPKV